jgi:hypothetical protein
MNGMKKFFVLVVIIIASSSFTNAQLRQTRGFDWNRVVYGGSILPVFSNLGTTIAANPFVGYKVTDNFVPGVMLSYNYSRLRDWPILGQTSTFNSLGVSPFVRYTFLEKFFAQAEYEFLNGNFKVSPPTQEASFAENNLFLGGGYINRIGGNGAIFVQVMYNVTWQGAAGNSVYASPFVYRVGFSIF